MRFHFELRKFCLVELFGHSCLGVFHFTYLFEILKILGEKTTKVSYLRVEP